MREREEGKKGMKKVGRKRKVRLELRWMRSVPEPGKALSNSSSPSTFGLRNPRDWPDREQGETAVLVCHIT